MSQMVHIVLFVVLYAFIPAYQLAFVFYIFIVRVGQKIYTLLWIHVFSWVQMLFFIGETYLWIFNFVNMAYLH